MRNTSQQYFYHPDHLGSSSFISDASGEACQFLAFLPFGEQWVDQRSSVSYDAPYKFSGKELDAETGYNYFGARYYDSGLNVWLIVDPLASKSPDRSPYLYCNANPLKFVDPDGKYSRIGATIRSWLNNGSRPFKSGDEWGYISKVIKEEDDSYTVKADFGPNKYFNSHSAGQVLFRSLFLKASHQNLSGDLLEKVQSDPAMIDYQNRLESDAKTYFQNNPDATYYNARPEVLTFGGPTKNPLNPLDPQTKEVIGNDLTWVLRHATVSSSVVKQEDGTLRTDILVTDRLDLRPRSGAGLPYNIITAYLGSIYHGILRGSPSRIKAHWSIVQSPEK